MAATDRLVLTDYSPVPEEERAFYDSWRGYEFEKVRTPLGFKGRWEKKNRVFEKESENID